MNSLRSFWQAATDFGQHITDVRVDALLIAVGFTLANLILRASAWRLILQAGYPERVRWRSIVGAYLAGAGVNSILPARGGDVMKIYLAHRAMPKAAYTTITSSLLAETLVDVFIGPTLLIAAYLTGRIPHLPALGHLAAFEWSFFAANARWFMLVTAVLLILLGVFFTYVERHVVAFWSRVRLGLIILTTPRRYFRTVVPLQLAGWCCRIGAMYWFLVAFHVPAGVVDAALALSAQSAATLLPFTPGGLGTQQALLGYMFRNAAATSTVLAFSVGMQVMVTLTTAVAGGIAIWITLRRLPWRARPPASADSVAPG